MSPSRGVVSAPCACIHSFFSNHQLSAKIFVASQRTGWEQLLVRPSAAGPTGLPSLQRSSFWVLHQLVSPQFRWHLREAFSASSEPSSVPQNSEVPIPLWAFLVSDSPAGRWVTWRQGPSYTILYFWHGRDPVLSVSSESEPNWINLCPIFSFMSCVYNPLEQRSASIKPQLHWTVLTYTESELNLKLGQAGLCLSNRLLALLYRAPPSLHFPPQSYRFEKILL